MDFSSLPQYPGQPPRSDATPQPPKESRDQVAATAWFRAGRWGFVSAFVLFVPLMGLGFALGLPLGVPWLIVAVIAAVSSHVVYSFRCPQCGKTFAWAWWWHSPFTNKCLHCGYRPPRSHERER